MSNPDALIKRARTLLGKVEQLQSPVERETPPIHLLTEQEQEQLQAFLILIPGEQDLRLLTDQQLERLEQWALLLEALKNGDEQAVCQYRQILQEAA